MKFGPALFLFATLAGCRFADNSQIKDTSTVLAPAPVILAEQVVQGSSLPSSGRSTFDFFVARAGGKVPFPFEALVARIRAEGYAPLSVFIPRGRSLQREAAAPDYFKFPRLVMTPTLSHLALVPKAPPDVMLESRMFIGFVEPAGQIEVISFNEALGRFEFQLVKDYAPGKTPRVVYATRTVCVACHQSGAPIFPENPWFETSASRNVGELISRAKDNTAGYLGFPLRGTQPVITPNAPFERDPVSQLGVGDLHVDVSDPTLPFNALKAPAQLDDAIRDANRLLDAAFTWKNGCKHSLGFSSPEECRAALLQEDDLGFQMLQQMKDLGFDGELAVDTLFPLAASVGGISGPFRDNIAHIGDMEHAIRSMSITEAFNPIVPRGSELKLPDHSITRAGENLALADRTYLRQHVPASTGVFADFLGHPDQHAEVLSESFDRAKILNAILAASGVPQRVAVPDPATLPAPTLDLPPNDDLAGDPLLVHFKQYCAACHSDPGVEMPPHFMAGTDDEIKAELHTRASRLIELLEWDAVPPPSKVMPPKPSSFYKKLAAPEHSAERLEMLIVLRGLL